MDPEVAAVQTYQCRCAAASIEPLPAFLDAVASGATVFTANTLSSPHIEALAAALPDTHIRDVSIHDTAFSRSSWALLIKALGRVRWERLSFRSCDLSAMDQRTLGSDCRGLRTDKLGASYLMTCRC